MPAGARARLSGARQWSDSESLAALRFPGLRAAVSESRARALTRPGVTPPGLSLSLMMQWPGGCPAARAPGTEARRDPDRRRAPCLGLGGLRVRRIMTRDGNRHGACRTRRQSPSPIYRR